MWGIQNGAQQYGAYGAPQGPATRTSQYGSHQSSTGQHGNDPLIITGVCCSALVWQQSHSYKVPAWS